MCLTHTGTKSCFPLDFCYRDAASWKWENPQTVNVYCMSASKHCDLLCHTVWCQLLVPSKMLGTSMLLCCDTVMCVTWCQLLVTSLVKVCDCVVTPAFRRYLQTSKLTSFLFSRSISRPGVATIICTPLCTKQTSSRLQILNFVLKLPGGDQ